MDIGNAKIVVGTSLKLFQDIIRGIYEHNANLRHVSLNEEISLFEGLKAKIRIDFDITPPELEFESRGSTQEPVILMNFGGIAKPKISFAGQTSDVLFEIEFWASAIFQVSLRQPGSGKAPVLGLNFLGVKNVSEPFNDEMINRLIAETAYVKLIEDFKLDILEPFISGIEDVYYADPLDVNSTPLPSHDSYPVAIRHMIGKVGIDAIGIFFGLPGDTLNVGLTPEFVPSGCEVLVHVSEGTLQSMVTKFKGDLQKWLMSFRSSLKISSLDLTVEDNAVSVYGKVEDTKLDASGTVTGQFNFHHRPGLNKIVLDGSDIDIDIDLPWWADLLLVILFPIGIVVYGALDYAEDKVPEIGQKMIGKMFNGMMDRLAESITTERLSIGGIPIEVYTDTIELDDNSLSIKIQVLIQPISETIARADYGKILGKFMYFTLTSGRQFRTEDLIRYMKLGLIRVPGYHVYGGKYIRSNPDNTTGNNLLERWGR